MELVTQPFLPHDQSDDHHKTIGLKQVNTNHITHIGFPHMKP